MDNKYLIGAGAIALGLFAYSRYTKKDDSGQGEDPNTGGGGGGTFFQIYQHPQHLQFPLPFQLYLLVSV